MGYRWTSAPESRCHIDPARISVSVQLLALLATLAVGPLARAENDPLRGLEIAIEHCSRCHVIGDYNRMGGIGSTPSFPGLTYLEDYVTRLQTFYTRRPHPAFARVPGYQKWSTANPSIPEFVITQEDISDIASFVKTLKPE